jgi:hypothetical protein
LFFGQDVLGLATIQRGGLVSGLPVFVKNIGSGRMKPTEIARSVDVE